MTYEEYCEDKIDDAIDSCCWTCDEPMETCGDGWNEPRLRYCEYEKRDCIDECPYLQRWLEDHYEEEEQ